MALSGTINLLLSDSSIGSGIIELLKKFKEQGWGVNYYGQIMYLPIKDEDFDWTLVPLSDREEVFSEIQKKEEREEIIGLNLVDSESNVGLSLLVYPKYEKVTLSLDINRKEIEGLTITDFSWYLRNIIPIFQDCGYSIEGIECVDG